MRRFTRLNNASSNKTENQTHALALYFIFYNFVCIYKTIKVALTMAVGIIGTFQAWRAWWR